jgi:hypothetical protein
MGQAIKKKATDSDGGRKIKMSVAHLIGCSQGNNVFSSCDDGDDDHGYVTRVGK